MADHIVFSTHGNLLALILQYYDSSIDFTFWKSLTIPDIYALNIKKGGEHIMSRLWNEKHVY